MRKSTRSQKIKAVESGQKICSDYEQASSSQEDESDISSLYEEPDSYESESEPSSQSDDSLCVYSKKERLPSIFFENENIRDPFDPPENKKIETILAIEKPHSDEELFLVKFKNLSYYNCEWLGKEHFVDPYSKQKVNRFYKNQPALEDLVEDNCDFSSRYLFDPSCLQVERIIHHRINIDEHEPLSEDNANEQEDSQKASRAENEDAKDEENEDAKEGRLDITKVAAEHDLHRSVSAPKFRSKVTVRNGDQDKKALLNDPSLSLLVRKYLEASTFEPAKRYEIYVEYLVKWRSVDLENCTWERPNNAEDEAFGQNILAKTSKKALRKFLEPHRLDAAIIKAAIKYERNSDLQTKLARLNLSKPPTSWHDPRSLRMGRPAKLPRGVEFEDWQPPLYKNENRLKTPYQEEGVKWLIYNWHMKRNCILADEMGLGKTIQTIGFVNYLFTEQKLRGPFMITVPKSTLHNWQREFENWTDFNVLNYDGAKASRDIIANYEFYFDDENNEEKTINYLTKFDVILTSYTLLITETTLRKFDYGLLIVDEAHRLKNHESKLYLELQEYTFQHCVFLTGTPLQNNITELWALLSLLEPKIFCSLEDFLKSYDTTDAGDDSAEKISDLHNKVLKPFMLRRMKQDVTLELKTPKEVIIWLRLTREQKTYFKAVFEQNVDFLHADGVKNAPLLNNIQMQLRHCCNHPFVLRGVEERTRREKKIANDEDMMKLLVNVSCKMDFLDKFLPMMKVQGHKVLVFSQFVLMLDILEDYLLWKKFEYERIDGSVDPDTRQNSIDRFNNDKDDFVFLLSTRAGGLGINLTSADTVIIYDSDWNPQNDLQALARAHRIGQTKAVTVYRLVTKGTYEEVMFQTAGKKLGLEKAVLHSWIQSGRDIEAGKSGKLNKEHLEKLLKFGAYHVLKDKEDDERPQSIEDILASSEVLKVESLDTKETVFSQATFKTTLDDNLSLDDPDFWRKIGLPKRDPGYGFYERRTRRSHQKRADESFDGSSDKASESHDDLFNSDDEAYWNRLERSSFESALLRFGYGRWDKIKTAAKVSKPDADCKRFALGLIKLYVNNTGKNAIQFMRSLKSDLLEIINVQLNKDFSGESDGAVSGEEGNKRENCESVDDLGGRFPNKNENFDKIVQKVEKRRDLYFKDSFELLDMLNLDSSLASEKWQKKRFSDNKNSEIKNLELLWIIKNFVEKIIQVDKDGVDVIDQKVDIPEDIETNLPAKWWQIKHDISLLKTAYEFGYETCFREFNNMCREKNLIPPDAKIFPTDIKIGRRLQSFLFRIKNKIIAHVRKKASPVKPPTQLFPFPLSKAEKGEKEKKVSKSLAQNFRKFVMEFPVKNPSQESSWENIWKDVPRCTDIFYCAQSFKEIPAKGLHEMFLVFQKEIELHMSPSDKATVMEKDGTLFDMTRNMAKKYKSRMELFKNIFRILDIPDLQQEIKNVVKHVKIPCQSWKTPESDIQILKGILKHGFGNWKNIAMDRELNFLFENTEEIPKDVKIANRIEQLATDLLAPKKNSWGSIDISKIAPPSGPVPLMSKNSKGKRKIEVIDLAGDPNISSTAKKAKRKTELKMKKTRIKIKKMKRVQNGKSLEILKGRDGKPVVPFKLKRNEGISVLSLGKIVFDNEKWHNENWIFPLGFKTKKVINEKNHCINEIISSETLSKEEKADLKIKSEIPHPVFKVEKHTKKENENCDKIITDTQDQSELTSYEYEKETIYSSSLFSLSLKLKERASREKENATPVIVEDNENGEKAAGESVKGVGANEAAGNEENKSGKEKFGILGAGKTEKSFTALSLFCLRDPYVVKCIEEMDCANLCKRYKRREVKEKNSNSKEAKKHKRPKKEENTENKKKNLHTKKPAQSDIKNFLKTFGSTKISTTINKEKPTDAAAYKKETIVID